MNSHRRAISAIFLFFLIQTNPAQINSALAIESSSEREAVIAPRAKRFYKSSRAREYLSFGGNYSSDYNSKNYQLNSRYLYQSENFIHEINFEYHNDYSDTGSGKSKKYDVEKSELYDLALASKGRIREGNNYAVFYHRSIYDQLSDYRYDQRTAIGLGRMFFKEKLEWDVSASYHDVAAYGHELDLITSWRANFKLSENVTLIQRAYFFFDHEGIDNQFKTSLAYRLSDKMSFEVRHNFEKRRYEEDNKRVVTNLVNRSVTIGLIFDLN